LFERNIIEILFQKLGFQKLECNWHFFKSKYKIDTLLPKLILSEQLKKKEENLTLICKDDDNS